MYKPLKSTEIRDKLLLLRYMYEQLWVVQSGETDSANLLLELKFIVQTINSLNMYNSFSAWQVGRIDVNNPNGLEHYFAQAAYAHNTHKQGRFF